MSRLKISIITVCLNSSNTIEDTIKSVISQTYDNIEYIVQDGQSTDNTLSIVCKYEQIKLYSEKDSGIYDAMNRAKNKATGDFLLYLGADDLLYSKDVIGKLVSSISSDNEVYYGNVLRTKKQKKFDGEFTKWKWGYQNICHQSIFYPRSIYKSKDYDMSYKLVADWVYNLQLLADRVNFKYVDIIVSKYNDIDGISSTRIDKKFLAERKELVIRAVGYCPYYIGLLFKLIKKII